MFSTSDYVLLFLRVDSFNVNRKKNRFNFKHTPAFNKAMLQYYSSISNSKFENLAFAWATFIQFYILIFILKKITELLINIFNWPFAFTVIQYQIWNTLFTVSFKRQLLEKKKTKKHERKCVKKPCVFWIIFCFINPNPKALYDHACQTTEILEASLNEH